MRIISGSLKGRNIKGFNIEGTRPTMDRVKGSIFGSIQNYIEDSVVLDLFAGSGNLGFEAISNGADKCYFVDNNIKCIRVIKDNIDTFNIRDKCCVIHDDYRRALNKIDSKLDLIFLDPPYKDVILDNILDLFIDNNMLNDGCILVLEYQVLNDNINDKYILLKNKKYGDKYVSIYKYKK